MPVMDLSECEHPVPTPANADVQMPALKFFLKVVRTMPKLAFVKKLSYTY